MRVSAAAPLTSLALLLACCGNGSNHQPSAAARVRLAEVHSGELLRAPAEEEKSILAEDFGAGIADWHAATDPVNLIAVEPGLLGASIEEEDGESLLALRGRRGALYRIVSIEPGACYEFSASSRARAIETSLDPYDGAAPWLAELRRDGLPEELFSGDPDSMVVERHTLPSARREDGWREHRLVFRTSPKARALAIACVLTFLGEVHSGSADFKKIELRRVPERRLWEELLAQSLAFSWRGERKLSDWRAQRLVRASLGAEVRPSIVCLPGETLRLRARIPDAKPRLETGIGPWPPSLDASVEREQTFLVRAGGKEVLRLRRSVSGGLADQRWRECEVDLSSHAGEEIELELSVEGDLPGMFGAPVVRDLSVEFSAPNLLLVSIDTLRADHVGCYGYAESTTPALDALAREGVLFRHVVTQAPYTLPAHSTLFSGQFPAIHGVQRPTDALSSVRSPLLAQILGREGYRTQAFTGGVFLNADFGFDKGFDGFDTIDPLRHPGSGFFRDLIERARAAGKQPHRGWDPPAGLTEELVREHGPERVLQWIEDHAAEPFFLFVHTYVVHDYDPPPGYLACREAGCTSERTDFKEFLLTRGTGWVPREVEDADREHLSHLYDAALRYVDQELGRLLGRLAELGLAERTLVVITSDHGEELFERGFVQHGKTLFEELLRIPLVMRVPHRAPQVIDEPVMSADIAPTILGALGLPPDPRMQGIDVLRARPDAHFGERPIWSEIHDDFVHKYSLRDPSGWKLIHAPPDDEVVFPSPREWSLFDLSSDPGETRDVAGEEPERLERLRASLERQRSALEKLARGLDTVEEGEVREETLEQLRQLGYVE